MSTKNAVNYFCFNKKEGKLNIDINDVVIFKNSDSVQ